MPWYFWLLAAWAGPGLLIFAVCVPVLWDAPDGLRTAAIIGLGWPWYLFRFVFNS